MAGEKVVIPPEIVTKSAPEVVKIPPDVVNCGSMQYGGGGESVVIDSISLATELGRLDLVSVLLAILGILLGLFAIIGFGYIRGVTVGVAKATTMSTVEAEISPVIARLEALVEKNKDTKPEYDGMPDEIKAKKPKKGVKE